MDGVIGSENCVHVSSLSGSGPGYVQHASSL